MTWHGKLVTAGRTQTLSETLGGDREKDMWTADHKYSWKTTEATAQDSWI